MQSGSTVRQYQTHPQPVHDTLGQYNTATFRLYMGLHWVTHITESSSLPPHTHMLCRSSVKKINLQEALGFAAAFHGPHGPGLLAITRTADVGVSTPSCCLLLLLLLLVLLLMLLLLMLLLMLALLRVLVLRSQVFCHCSCTLLPAVLLVAAQHCTWNPTCSNAIATKP